MRKPRQAQQLTNDILEAKIKVDINSSEFQLINVGTHCN